MAASKGKFDVRHCERSDAIQLMIEKNLDCFVAFAPRNDG